MSVDVCMITYNHEKYIAESIESVLKQQTNFDVTLVIGEDGSKDGTRDICEDYAMRHPGKIILLPPKANLGMMKNFLQTFEACNGDYIAFLEGDDYWTDSLKLQKQVNFLEANPDYSLCFHNTIIKEEKNDGKKDRILHANLKKETFTTEDVLGPWFVPSCTSVFKNYPNLILPTWFANCKYGDLPFMLLLSLKGKFRYIDEIMSVYRLHNTGMSSVHKAYDKVTLMIYIYESFNIHTNYKFQAAVREAIKYEIDRHIPLRNAEITTVISEPSEFTKMYNRIKSVFS